MKKMLVFLMRFYKQFVSRLLVLFLGHACRFQPSCSEYFVKALEKYGLVKGGFMGIKRIARCNPLSEIGYDPVI